MMNNEWQMKGAYVSQSATITKLLKEGWEPYWGYRCKRNDKDDVRMYFKKAPEPVAIALPTIETVEAPNINIDLSPIVGILDGLPKRIADELLDASLKLENDERGEAIQATKAVEVREVIDDEWENEREQFAREADAIRKPEEVEPPAGEGFRVVDDVPDLPVKQMTSKQIEVVGQIRRSAFVNITVYPVDPEGNVRVYSAGDILTVHPDGEVSKQANPAGRDSTTV